MDEFTQKITEIDIFGFTIVENVLTNDEVDQMKEALIKAEETHVEETGHLGTASHVANLLIHDPIFFKCIDHPKVLPLVEATMGENIILGSLNSRIVRPGDGYQGLHSDVPIEHTHQIGAPIMINTVWPLSDYSKENGAKRVVPGSHRSGLQKPPEGFEIPYEMQPEIKAGSVIIFNGQTWHGGGQNNTKDENRYAMFGHYRVEPWMLFQCDPHHNFPEENFALLSDRQKKLLRMQNGLGAPRSADFYHGY